MSTDVEVPETTKHELTRGALQLILKLSARTEPFKKAGSTKRWLRLCKRLKDKYQSTKGKCGDQEVDFDKKFLRLPEDTDVTWQTRVAMYEEAFAEWEKQPVTIELSSRDKRLIETAVRWAMKARTDIKVQNKPWPFNDYNVLSILEAFKEVCIEDDDENEENGEDE